MDRPPARAMTEVRATIRALSDCCRIRHGAQANKNYSGLTLCLARLLPCEALFLHGLVTLRRPPQRFAAQPLQDRARPCHREVAGLLVVSLGRARHHVTVQD